MDKIISHVSIQYAHSIITQHNYTHTETQISYCIQLLAVFNFFRIRYIKQYYNTSRTSASPRAKLFTYKSLSVSKHNHVFVSVPLRRVCLRNIIPVLHGIRNDLCPSVETIINDTYKLFGPGSCIGDSFHLSGRVYKY